MARSPSPTVALGCAGCLAAAASILVLGDVRQSSVSFVALALAWAAAACVVAWAIKDRPILPVLVIGAAVGLRVLTLGTEPSLSDDVYRYLWEGRVLAAGFDPFQLPPDAPELSALRNDHWALVNHRDVSTLYPPLALALFEGVARLASTVLSWKILTTIADLVCLALLVRLCAARGTGAWAPALWALHPLPVLESAGSGHLESLALAPLLGAMLLAARHPILAILTATVGSLVKLLPLAVAVPILARKSLRTQLVGVGLIVGIWALAIAPYLEAGPSLLRGFRRYAQAWEFNPSLFPLIEWVAGSPLRGRALGLCVGTGICLWALRRRPLPTEWLLWATGALVLLSPVVHPWYLLWPLAPALVLGAWPWAVLASTILVSYLVLGSYDPRTSEWVEAWWIPWVAYLPFLLATLAWHRAQRRPSPS